MDADCSGYGDRRLWGLDLPHRAAAACVLAIRFRIIRFRYIPQFLNAQTISVR